MANNVGQVRPPIASSDNRHCPIATVDLRLVGDIALNSSLRKSKHE